MKKTVVIRAPAKLNLYLDITGRREDGFHNIETVMQSISLYDTVTVRAVTNDLSGRINISCSDSVIPTDERNICRKAAVNFFEYTHITPFALDIHIEKNIPQQAGMGGGSADGAAVIAALARISGISPKSERLCEIGSLTGADVPFCIFGGTRYCLGIGEDMRQLADMPDCAFVIGKGREGISTAEAYRRADAFGSFKGKDIAEKFSSAELKELAGYCRNIFTKAADLPEVHEITRLIGEAGALCAQLTGSGSAVFGIFEEKKAADKCAAKLAEAGYYAAVAFPERNGAEITEFTEEE